MHTSLHGAVARPTVAVVGVWDPMVEAHRDLFGRMVEHARANNLASLAIVLDPSPPAMLNGLERFPTYDDVPSRINSIRRHGVDGVLVGGAARPAGAGRGESDWALGRRVGAGRSVHARDARRNAIAPLRGARQNPGNPLQLSHEPDTERFSKDCCAGGGDDRCASHDCCGEIDYRKSCSQARSLNLFVLAFS